MKTTIRQNTFETNSSSVHAFVFIPNELLDIWSSPDHNTDYLDFGALLDEIGAVGAAYVDVPVTAREDVLVDESVFYDKKSDKEMINEYYFADEQEAIGATEMMPYDLLENPEKYRTWGRYPDVKVQGDGVMVEIDYDGWRS